MPRCALVVTFDDGYADLLHHAKPLLERYQTPATVFVATGFLGREFWWDKLDRVLLSSAKLPEQLSLQNRGGTFEWVPSGPSLGSGPDSGRRVIQSIHRSLLPLSPVERDKAMAQLWAWSETAPNDRPSRRALTGEELTELAAGDLIAVGAHTVSHPNLASLPIHEQRGEIQGSKKYLEELLGQPVISFAYPNGSSSSATRTIVRECGFECACAIHKDVVWRGSDPFYLPRFWVPDCDGKSFSHWLRLWLST